MTYYDNIAQRWHTTTGNHGGAFKELVLNELLLEQLSRIDHCSILELGAGNGYFLPLVLRRFADQEPSHIVITDHSERLLDIAKRHFRIPEAEYRWMEISRPFPFADAQFDLIIAAMVFNEVPAHGWRKGLHECHRVLARDGQLLLAVTHPDFIDSLRKQGALKATRTHGLTMPGAGSLRLPVVIRSLASYRRGLQEAGFEYEETEGYSTIEVLERQPGLRNVWKVPVALVYTARKATVQPA